MASKNNCSDPQLGIQQGAEFEAGDSGSESDRNNRNAGIQLESKTTHRQCTSK